MFVCGKVSLWDLYGTLPLPDSHWCCRGEASPMSYEVLACLLLDFDLSLTPHCPGPSHPIHTLQADIEALRIYFCCLLHSLTQPLVLY